MTTAPTILAATDLSAPARHAVERAFRIAAGTGGELYILHALELDPLDDLRETLGGDVSPVKEALLADARERLRQLIEDAAAHRHVVARPRIAVGNPLSTIAEEVETLDARLAVLGVRGESFLRHALLGTTAARLLRKSARCPVLVVKQPSREDYSSVLVALDFSPASLDAIRIARRFAPGADLALLHAFELPYEGKLAFAGVDEGLIRQYVATAAEAKRKRLHDLATAAGLAPTDYSAHVVHGNVSQRIAVLEQEVDADLIVVGKHGTHVAEELLLGSVTKRVLSESECDVLVVCDPRPAAEETP